MSALGKYMEKFGNKAKDVLKGAGGELEALVKGREVAGPAGAFKRSGYIDSDGPIMRPRFNGQERAGGLSQLLEGLGIPEGMDNAKKFATKSPLHAAGVGAAAGAAGMGLGSALSNDGDADDLDEDKVKELCRKLGVKC